jgi:hypothetical protein
MGIITKIRSVLYGSAKILGDVNAVEEGKIISRAKNRFFGRLAGKLLQKLLR